MSKAIKLPIPTVQYHSLRVYPNPLATLALAVSLCLQPAVGWAGAGDDEASLAYGDLMAGKLPGAETTFQKMAKSSNAEVAIKGEEGLAETELKRGKIVEASLRIDRVIQKSPKRTMARAIKAKVYYKQGKKKEAESELNLAAQGKSDFRWQKASVHTLKGNLHRQQKNSAKAVESYQQALQDDPENADALTNLGVTLQELGKPQEAIKAFTKLNQTHSNDKLGAALLRQAQAAVAQQQDLAKQQYINGLVKDLVQRYQQQQTQDKPADDWTTSAAALSIMGFSDTSDNLDARAGLNLILQNELTSQLQAANIKVVERAILDKVMSELNLGSSNLADPDTALKLGKIIAARLIANGSIAPIANDENLVNLRLIDTETTDIVLPLSERQSNSQDPLALAGKLAQAIVTAVKQKYPMKGRIASADGDSVIINLGKKHNIQPGMLFNVLSDNEEPIELNGKVLGTRQTKVGQLQVTSVEDLMSYAKPVGSGAELAKNQKIIQTQ